MLKSKIHRATVTDADLHYVGSMTLDPLLMEAVDFMVHEKVEIYNVTNGERFSTYVIEGERGAGQVVLNGAAAHKAGRGDLVIICSYAEYEAKELEEHKPTVVFVDHNNQVIETHRAVLAREEPLAIAAN
jgi:aspartate 1-decarboxylase